MRRAARLGAWACGFVLSASPRQVTPERAAWLAGEAGDALTVAVVTTEPPDWIADALAQAGLQAVQLSAGADGASVSAVREAAARRGLRPLIIAAADTPDAAAADLTLLDARTAQAYGGTGQALDWAALAHSRQTGEVGPPAPSARERLVLAGGLTPANVAQAIATCDPWPSTSPAASSRRPASRTRPCSRRSSPPWRRPTPLPHRQPPRRLSPMTH